MNMKAKISALIDGELSPHEMRDACIALRHDEALRRTCCTYAVIGDALRREPFLSTELSGAVFDHLADEPVVLAPKRMADFERRERHRMLAMAAGLVGVAVVVWFGLGAPEYRKAQLAEQKTVVLASAKEIDMQEYLIAHQIYSGSISLNGDAQHIRSVSLSGAEPRR